jgi:glutathione peroxidase
MLHSLDGKVCLFVNIASKSGYEPKCSKLWSHVRTTRQMWELQKLHEMFDDFSVVGFPCNQFGAMEPSANEEINEFIKNFYPFITFPISEKIEVNGCNEHPLYTFLKGPEIRLKDDNPADTSDAAVAGQNKAGQAMYRIPHNYEKFVINSTGQNTARFSWRDMPLAEEPASTGSVLTIIEAIKIALS